MTQPDWKVRADRVVMNTYGRQPLVLVRGEGSRVWDAAGREYLDFVAGLAVCNLGHAHPAIAQAASEQLSRLVHVSNLYYTTPMVELAEELVCLSFADRVFFCNSGTEAMEGAIKLCRRYAAERFGPDRHKIVCMHNSFHGRTFGALSATGQKKFWQGFEPLLPGFVFVPFNELAALQAALDDTVCAVILEPVQGEGGVNLASREYLEAVRRECSQKGILLVFDEVQCGLGRTGRLFAYQHYGVTPDIMALAKALAGGLPMGALLATEEAAQGFVPGTHASTFGGGPVIAAAAKASLRILCDPCFLEAVREKGDYLREKFEGLKTRFSVIEEVRGLGLMWGMQLSQDGTPVVTACRERGLLVNCTQGNIIRLLPPLVVEQAELDQGMEILTQALEATFHE
jgi:acetylornithine/N-succinyldiaminopimelate aminotransferase